MTFEQYEAQKSATTMAVDEPRLTGARYTFAYLARASVPGRFALPPATVEDMFRPDLNGRTAAGRFEVLGPRQ